MSRVDELGLGEVGVEAAAGLREILARAVAGIACCPAQAF